MKSLKYERPSYNREQLIGDLVSNLLCIDINTLDYGGFQFYQTLLT